MKKDKLGRWSCIKMLIVGVILACIGTMGIVGYVAWQLRDWEPFVSDALDPATIETYAKIALPPSAHDIYAHTEGFIDNSTQVRFAMDAEELSPFLSSTLCDEPLTPKDPDLESEFSLTWWRPMDAQVLQGCWGEREQFRQEVLWTCPTRSFTSSM